MPLPLAHRRPTEARAPSPPDPPDPQAAEDGAPEHGPVVSARAARATRDEAFTAFVEAASPGLLRTAWLLTGDAHRAEELVQQALVRTYTAWPRLEEPAAYARRVLVNARVDSWRRRQREVLTASPPERGAPRDEHATTNDRDQLVRALALLTPRQRRIVVLRHLLCVPEAEIAAELGVSVGTVKSTASRCLQRLREVLGPEGAIR